MQVKRRRSALDIFQRYYRVMTSKNGADFVQFVMQAQAPASQIGQSRAKQPLAVAHFVGSDLFTIFFLGLTPQALCCRLLRRLKAKVLKHKTPHNLVSRVLRESAHDESADSQWPHQTIRRARRAAERKFQRAARRSPGFDRAKRRWQ